MSNAYYVGEIKSASEFFDRSTKVFTEDHANFVPHEGMLTVAQQVAHVAQTVEWFLEGAFRPEGFDLDFEKHYKLIAGIPSLAEARAWKDRAFQAAIDKVENSSPEELNATIVEGMIMGGAPRYSIVGAITDHTAHHRGALTAYARALGMTAPMPYMDM